MELKTQQFIEKALSRAEYKFDESVNQWAGWVKGFPGIYAQGKNIENVRQIIAEMLEEYLFASFQKQRKIPGFNLKTNIYAKAC